MTSEPKTSTAFFTISMQPAAALVAGTGRLELTKEWSGAIRGTSTGVMLTAGDPNSGSAGYVAIETVTGSLDGRAGSFVLAQLGAMDAGNMSLRYEVVPGSGTVDLIGLTGHVTIVADEGLHEVEVVYSLPSGA